ncbi:MAG: hypothetical protein QM778_26535 [Myxococcales bacterium]
MRWWLLLSAILCVATVTRAEPDDKPPPGYTRAISNAVTELNAGNFAEAREEFAKAHALFPSARSLRGLGLVEFELRNYKVAVGLLEECLASTVRPLDAKMRADVVELLARTRSYLGELKLEIEPSEASVRVGGTAIDRHENGGILVLEIGEHTLQTESDGYLSQTHTVRIEGGKRVELSVKLQKREELQLNASITPMPLPPSSSADEQAGPRPVYKRWLFWTGLGLAVAGGVVATTLLLRDHSVQSAEPQRGPNATGVTLFALGGR